MFRTWTNYPPPTMNELSYLGLRFHCDYSRPLFKLFSENLFWILPTLAPCWMLLDALFIDYILEAITFLGERILAGFTGGIPIVGVTELDP